jgi:hypothetical protein
MSSHAGAARRQALALRALATTELKNANKSSGCVSKTWLRSSGSTTQGCLLRVQKCAAGRSQEMSSKVPARTARNVLGFGDGPANMLDYLRVALGGKSGCLSCDIECSVGQDSGRHSAKSIGFHHPNL